jgi:hypothetical protein
MKHTNTKAVLLPVDLLFLEAIFARQDRLTALVWGWQTNPKRMAEPHRILDRDQAHLPFLFSATEQEKKQITHAAVCGKLWHRDEVSANELDWLEKHRVEKFTGTEHHWRVGSVYVVTACTKLNHAIAYADVSLVSGDKPLSPDKRHGYAIVYLPAGLHAWFDEGCRQWDALMGELPASASQVPGTSNGNRSK